MAGCNTKRMLDRVNELSARQLQNAIFTCKQGLDQSGFEEKNINDYIGAGIFTTKSFKKGAFLLEYQGDLITYREARKREEEYKRDDSIGNFMFFFKYNEKTMCVDATNDIFSMGRMVNDATPGTLEENSTVKIVMVDKCPHLCIFASRDIDVGEEIRYDYGVPDLPWRKKEVSRSIKESSKQMSIETDNVPSKEKSRGTDNQPSTQMPRSDDNKSSNEIIKGTDSHSSKEKTRSTVNKPSRSHEKLSEEMYGSHDNEYPQDTAENPDESLQLMSNYPYETSKEMSRNPDIESSKQVPIFTEKDLLQKKTKRPDVSSKYVSKCQDKTLKEVSVSFDNRSSNESANKQSLQEISRKTNKESSREMSVFHIPSKGNSRNCDKKSSTKMPKNADNETSRKISRNIVKETFKEINHNTDDSSEETDEDLFIERDSGSEYIPSDDQPMSTEEEYISDSCSSEIFPVQVPKSKKQKLDDQHSLYENMEPEAHDEEYFCCTTQRNHSEQFTPEDQTACIPLIPAKDKITTTEERHMDKANKPTNNNASVTTHKINPSVPTTNNSRNIRIYDKFFYCMYCKKGLKNLPPHLRSQHPDEKEVIEWEMEKDIKKKNNLYTKIRNLGSHIHNCQVIQDGQGELSVRYRPTYGSSNIDEYGPCPHCFGYYVLRDLWRHNCPLKPETIDGTSASKITAASKLLIPCPRRDHSILHRIIAGMRVDSIGRLVKGDTLIIDFGEKLCNQHGHDQDQHNYIRQKLRELGRLLQNIKKSFPEFGLRDVIDPKYYQLVVNDSKSVSGFDPSTNRYETPSLALKIGHSLKNCTNIVISSAIQCGDREKLQKAQEFLQLLEINWTNDISSNALKTLNEAKWNSRSALPLAGDVKLLTSCLSESAAFHHQCLADITSINDRKARKSFSELTEIVLAKTVIFNRRRSGEVSKMKLEDYYKKSLTTEQDDPIAESLSKTERQLCKTLQRVEICGKRGRNVPVLFSDDIIFYLDQLISKRNQFVSPNNKFLFARVFKQSNGHLRGSASIRKFAFACNAKEPERLTSTKLRKQIATMSQILNLKENELDILANFMGHDIRVHREYYRLPEATIQVAKVSKLLLLMEKGGKGLTAGETLDSLSLEDLDEKQKACEKESDDSELDSEWESENSEEETESDHHSQQATSITNVKEDQKKAKKRHWSAEEINAVYRHLQRFIISGKLPGKKDIDRCQESEPILESRSWRNIRDFCRNKSISQKRTLQKQ